MSVERAHDLVMSFQRQKNYLTDFHLNNVRYLRHQRDKNITHVDFADFANNRVRQESVFICGICGTKIFTQISRIAQIIQYDKVNVYP